MNQDLADYWIKWIVADAARDEKNGNCLDDPVYTIPISLIPSSDNSRF